MYCSIQDIGNTRNVHFGNAVSQNINYFKYPHLFLELFKHNAETLNINIHKKYINAEKTFNGNEYMLSNKRVKTQENAKRMLNKQTISQQHSGSSESSSNRIQNKTSETENIFRNLKKLKFKRMRKAKRINLKSKLIKFKNDNFPSTYCTQKFLYERDISIQGTLDYIETFVNYAAKYRNQFVLYKSMDSYAQLLSEDKQSPRTLFQQSDTLALLSLLSNSSTLFNKSIEMLLSILEMVSVTDEHYKKAAQKCVKLFEGRQWYRDVLSVQTKVVVRFPNDTDALNKLGSLYLKVGENIQAKHLFENSVKLKPSDGFALANLGYILYTMWQKLPSIRQKYSESWHLLKYSADLTKRAIQSGHSSIMNGKYFYQYGSSLNILGMIEERDEVFTEAARLGLLPSFWQRCPHYVKGIKAKPISTIQETKIGYLLETIRKKWKSIRNEAMYIFDHNWFELDNESLSNDGK